MSFENRLPADLKQHIAFVRALAQSESQLRKAQAMAHVGSWQIDAKTKTVWGSEEARRILGLGSSQQPQTFAALQEIVDPADRPRFESALTGVIAGETQGDMEFRIKRANDGAVRFLQCRAERILDAEGDPVLVVGVVQDVTERKLAEDALKESERRFRLFFELGFIGMAFTSSDGKITNVNEKLCEILGYSRQELIGISWRQLVHAEDLGRILERLQEITAGYADGYVLDKRLLRKDGQVVSTSASVRCLRHDDGSIDSFLALIQDTTERTRAEQEKEMLQGQLRQAQKMEAIGRLAGGVAHDFNNLLAPILGYTELLLTDKRQDSDRRRELEQIRKAADRARDLTKQLLALGRKQVLSIAAHDLRNIVTDFEPLLRRTIREEISIVVKQSERSLMVSADAGQIQRVLMNLAVNAQDAITGAGVITIEMREETFDTSSVTLHPETAEGRFAVMSVRDSGCGMDPAIQGRLFEPFFTTKGVGKGNGLGLSTAFGIIKQHGGHITAHSQPGKGSTFRVFLPLRSETPESVPLLEAADVGKPQDGQTVLVVEDDDGVRDLIVTMLAKLGYKALSAESSQRALTFMEREGRRISLVLTDVMMPGANAKELLGRLRTTQPELKVLFMSGYTKDVIAQSGVLEERANFIPKPFSAETLGRKLRDVLG